MVTQTAPLVLGSGSPRRRDILAQLGFSFRVLASDVPEPPPEGEDPRAYAVRLAELKATTVAVRPEARIAGFVLGADTIVVLDGQVLGKPSDDAHALGMLNALSGTTHEVITAVSLVVPGRGVFESIAEHTRVRFRRVDAETLRRYVRAGEGRDKAGAYAAQGLGAGLVEHIEGSYSNVVGLPASQTLALLVRGGAVERWP